MTVSVILVLFLCIVIIIKEIVLILSQFSLKNMLSFKLSNNKTSFGCVIFCSNVEDLVEKAIPSLYTELSLTK